MTSRRRAGGGALDKDLPQVPFDVFHGAEVVGHVVEMGSESLEELGGRCG